MSLDDWLASLEIKIKIEELNETNLQRTVQLLNKTNQMNLSTRRMTEKELFDWVKGKNRKLWTFRVSDRLSDSGLTGILSIEVQNHECQVVDFILSCRVIGRKVEETMLFKAIQYSRSLGLNHIKAEYIPTPKNAPCVDFWKKSGFQFNEATSTFTWNLEKEYVAPHQIEVLLTDN